MISGFEGPPTPGWDYVDSIGDDPKLLNHMSKL